MKRFVLWAAVSSQPQVEKISLDDQITQGRQHAERHGGQIVAELGLAMLTEPDARAANAWFRRHIRVWIYPDRTITVEIL